MPRGQRPRTAHEELFSPTGQGGYPELRIVQRNIGGHFEVWLNTGEKVDDGVCIAAGSTRQLAVKSAVNLVEWLEHILQSPPPALATPG